MSERYQLVLEYTGILLEPNTYYPTKELAEKAIPAHEKAVPSLAGKLVVVRVGSA